MRIPINKDTNDSNKGRRGSYDSYNWSQLNDIPQSSSTGIEAIDMAAHLKLLGESLCSIGMCLKRQVLKYTLHEVVMKRFSKVW